MTTIRYIPETDEHTLFTLGKIVVAPSVLARFSPEEIALCLKRHKDGFRTFIWETRLLHANPEAAITGCYVSDQYLENHCEGEPAVTITTEADRSATTVRLHSEVRD